MAAAAEQRMAALKLASQQQALWSESLFVDLKSHVWESHAVFIEESYCMYRKLRLVMCME